MNRATELLNEIRHSLNRLRRELYEPPRLIYTINGAAQGPHALLQKSEDSLRAINGSIVVDWEAQNLKAREVNQRAIDRLAERGLHFRRFVSTRLDLFTHEYEPPSDLVRGPRWDNNSQGLGAKVVRPSMSAIAEDPDPTQLNSMVSKLTSEGYQFPNHDSNASYAGSPYEPKVNSFTKIVAWNGTKVRLNAPEWQDAITDYLVEAVNDLKYEGILVQLAKCQHYSHKIPSFVRWVEGGMQPFIGKIQFDQMRTSLAEHFDGFEQTFWKLRRKTGESIILDLMYFGVQIWRYVKIITGSDRRLKDRFFERLASMIVASDYVIHDDSQPNQRIDDDGSWNRPVWFDDLLASRQSVNAINLKT